MPGAVPVTSTRALTNATLPYVLHVADAGVAQAARENPGLAKGVNVVDGKVTYQPVAEATGQPYAELFEALGVAVESAYDAVIVGGGHNGLVAAAYLARAGRSVLVLERRDHVGGAAVSERPWPGVDARLSRYSYLVSLLPRAIARGARAAASSCAGAGLLLHAAAGRHRAAGARGRAAARRAGARVLRDDRARRRRRSSRRSPSRCSRARELRARVGDDAAWEALVERPLGETLDALLRRRPRARRSSLTDALIGTFAGARRRVAAPEPLLPLPRDRQRHGRLGRAGRRHGRGHRARSRRRRAAAGAELRCGAEVTAIETDGDGAEVRCGRRRARRAGHVLANVAPARAGAAAGRAAARARRPRARSSSSTCCSRGCRGCATRRRPARGVRGHVPRQRVRHAARARPTPRPTRGRIPSLPPCEIYCHSLTDPSILGAELRARGRADADLLRAAHAGAAVPRGPARRAKARGDRGDAALARTACSPSRSRTACGARRTASRAWRRARRSSSRPSSACPAATSSTATCAWPFAEDEAEVGHAGASRPRTRERAAVRRGRAARRRRQRHPRPQRRDGRAHEADQNLTLTLESSSMAVEQQPSRGRDAARASTPSTSTTSGGRCRCTSLGMLLATINSGTLIIALPDLERALHTSILVARLGDPRLHDLLDRARAVRRAGCRTCSGASRPTSLGFVLFGLASLGAGFSGDGTELILWRIAAGHRRRVPVRQRRRARHRRVPARAARAGDGHQHDGRRRRARDRAGARRRAGRHLLALGVLVQRPVHRWSARCGRWLILRELAKPDRVRGYDIPGVITFVAGPDRARLRALARRASAAGATR